MRVGVVGLGKVGLPLALVLAHAGRHDVVGYDLDLEVVHRRLAEPAFARERGWLELVAVTRNAVRLVDSPDHVVKHSEVILVVVQTPHDEDYGGDRPMPSEPRDFDYTYLQVSLASLNHAALAQEKSQVVGVVSTVLPGTLTERLDGSFPNLRLGYCPALVSLGAVVPDLLHPDFVLVGADDERVGDDIAAVFEAVSTAPVHRTSVVEAELIKVALNAFISTKIVFANALGQLAHRLGANVDRVTAGLALSDAVGSERYLHAGLGDGGACRPRDVIALSWLAEKHDLTHDPFVALAGAREDQSWYLTGLVRDVAERRDLPIVVLGEAYKPGTAITDGSPARLLAWQLGDVPMFDPVVNGDGSLEDRPTVFVLATPHPEVLALELPAGSVVVDPWGAMPERENVEVVRPGRSAP